MCLSNEFNLRHYSAVVKSAAVKSMKSAAQVKSAADAGVKGVKSASAAGVKGVKSAAGAGAGQLRAAGGVLQGVVGGRGWGRGRGCGWQVGRGREKRAGAARAGLVGVGRRKRRRRRSKKSRRRETRKMYVDYEKQARVHPRPSRRRCTISKLPFCTGALPLAVRVAL
jgi:hypothetical protein